MSRRSTIKHTRHPTNQKTVDFLLLQRSDVEMTVEECAIRDAKRSFNRVRDELRKEIQPDQQ